MNKVFFTPGDVVKLRQDLDGGVPDMIVKSIDKIKTSGDDRPQLFGVTCYWFTMDKLYQERRFNTKDLIHKND